MFSKQLIATIEQITTKSDSDLITNAKNDLKQEYRRLVLVHHPDHGGSTVDFNKLQQQYESLLQKINNPAPFNSSSIDTSSNSYSSLQDGTVMLGVKRSVLKRRAIEPSHVEIIFNVSLKELYEGFNQEIRYVRSRYTPDRIYKEEVVLNVHIHSSLMNEYNEIVFTGYGDQGLAGDKADLVLLIKIEDIEHSITYVTKEDNSYDLPLVTYSILTNIHEDKLLIEHKGLGIKQEITINPKTISATIPKKGLLYRVVDHSSPTGYRLERGNYKVFLTRYY